VSDGPPPRLHFGGPDRPQRFLRDLLQARIEAVPSGGEIAWVTYYFRDRALADALIRASDRGVRVRVAIEGEPRNPTVNAAVVAMLRDHGLRGGLVVHRPHDPRFGRRAYLHSKIYLFSHPSPHALVGSFNPSGDEPEDDAILADIGDQDRGHNLLVELSDARLVRGLRKRVGAIGRPLPKLSLSHNLGLASGPTRMFFYPRLRTDCIGPEIRALGPGDRVVGAISHLKPDLLTDALAAAAQRGASVSLIVHDTDRRVPEESVEQLSAAGSRIRRYEHPQGLPLHAKFLLVERAGESAAWFGSFNFNKRSRLYNHELLVRSTDPFIVAGLAERYREISAEVTTS
jgi:hypothetical protein